ncbi:hypothetical protein BC939DRAFT_110478 [Gamsiella multidivaricata]|uniref:uncharacterized protein n=1 Tax=Gamsiella multidivaricata TaxID=101098 RepID=UPI00221EB0AF|nr:uncharacterized protein BC939DRAFT_110478 [Gamsiella multidivaricata]KAI7827008.1 hypothetical protein BC939DRAFT_110478 [Gamsiella multidivaricata]
MLLYTNRFGAGSPNDLCWFSKRFAAYACLSSGTCENSRISGLGCRGGWAERMNFMRVMCATPKENHSIPLKKILKKHNRFMPQEYQAFRVFPDGPITRIEVSTDEETGLHTVFWEDIEFQFPGIHCVMHGDIAISLARDAKKRRIEPKCIKYHPEVILDVILVNDAGLGFARQRSTDDSVSSLLVRSPPQDDSSSIGGDSVHSPVEQDGALSQSFSSLSVNSAYQLIDNGEQQQQQQQFTSTLAMISTNLSRTPSTSRVPRSPGGMLPSTPETTPSTDPFIPRIQTTLQTSAHLFSHFEQSIKSGQLHQAESIKEEIRTAFMNLQAEMARNQELQMLMLELQQTAAEMQQKMLRMQQQALDRLAVIQNRVQAVLTQTYELHEYPIPRLFIVLPGETQRRDIVLSPFTSRFRLYFLCECGEHTKQHQPMPMHLQDHAAMPWSTESSTSVDSGASGRLAVDSGSRVATQHIHIAKHEGYDLDRPNEFFRKYGSHILTLLQMLKYGVVIAGFVVPPLAHLRFMDGIDKVQDGLMLAENSLEPKVDYAIQYLESLAYLPADNIDNIDRNMVDGQNPAHELEALEGADLRHLSKFLKNKDEGKVLGNLYRTVTSEGRVKWVCIDHYRENYRDSAIRQFKDVVAVNGGSFEEETGKVAARLSSSMVARQFYDALERAKFIQELFLVLDWEATLEDLRLLRDIVRKTNVVSLNLDFCNTQGPTRDVFSRSRRYDPILQMMANTKLQSFYLVRCDGFWSRLTKTVASATTSMPSAIQLRILSVQGAVENRKMELNRIEEVLGHCSQLTCLKLQCLDVDATFAVVRNTTGGFRNLQTLELSACEEKHRQEQVDITIQQPQAEIMSMTIMTNKKPYTQLVFSGYVRRLVLYDQLNLTADQPVLERIIQENKQLVELGVRCLDSEVVAVFETIQACCRGNQSLKRVEVQDTEGGDKVLSANMHDPRATQLKLRAPDSTAREGILKAFGWALKKVPPGLRFTSGLLHGLESAMRRRGSTLEKLHVDITMLDEESLDLLTKVI